LGMLLNKFQILLKNLCLRLISPEKRCYLY
jgi:hypothetical protein